MTSDTMNLHPLTYPATAMFERLELGTPKPFVPDSNVPAPPTTSPVRTPEQLAVTPAVVRAVRNWQSRPGFGGAAVMLSREHNPPDRLQPRNTVLGEQASEHLGRCQ